MVDDADRAALAESLYECFVRVPVAVLATFRGDAVARAVYLELASRAVWREPRTVTTAHGPVSLDVGQMCFGRTEVAEAIGFTERRTRAAIERLIRVGYLVVKTSKLGTVGTLVGVRENLQGRQVERPSECPSPGQKRSSNKIPDPPESSSFSGSDPEPGHVGRGDHVQAEAETKAALANLEALLTGRKRPIAAAADRADSPPTLQILQGGTP